MQSLYASVKLVYLLSLEGPNHLLLSSGKILNIGYIGPSPWNITFGSDMPCLSNFSYHNLLYRFYS